jgi:hypothetical protein
MIETKDKRKNSTTDSMVQKLLKMAELASKLLPRCIHGNPMRDFTGAILYPSCGCKEKLFNSNKY